MTKRRSTLLRAMPALQHWNFIAPGQSARHFKRIREEQLAKKAAAEEALGIDLNSVSMSWVLHVGDPLNSLHRLG